MKELSVLGQVGHHMLQRNCVAILEKYCCACDPKAFNLVAGLQFLIPSDRYIKEYLKI